jgi:PAS domain S-box-containing protein
MTFVPEERLRLMLQSVCDYAIFMLNIDGEIAYWNTGAERVFGWSSDEAVGRHSRIVFTPEDRLAEAAEEEMRAAASCGRAADERWLVKKDGSRFYASGVLTPMSSGAGEIVGYVKVARDLTERKHFAEDREAAHDQLEQRVRRATAELIDANTRLEAEVAERRAAHERIQALFQRLVDIQENERRRIARELHDQLGQPMTALRMQLDVLSTSADAQPPLAEQLARARRLAEELDDTIDSLAWELRPAALDQLGLAAALASLVRGWSERFSIDAEFGSSWPENFRLRRDVEVSLYRIAQEALHNVVKHARADHVSAVLEHRHDMIVLIIEDNGRGFPSDEVAQGRVPGGLGLVSMRERVALIGGELTIESVSGQGTSLFIRVPWRPPTATNDSAP